MDRPDELAPGKIIDTNTPPEPTGLVCVDSKFPLENYNRMFDAQANDAERGLIPPASEVVLAHGDGCWLWDADGNEYVDYHAAFAPHLLGHDAPLVVDDRQLGRRRADVDAAGCPQAGPEQAPGDRQLGALPHHAGRLRARRESGGILHHRLF